MPATAQVGVEAAGQRVIDLGELFLADQLERAVDAHQGHARSILEHKGLVVVDGLDIDLVRQRLLELVAHPGQRVFDRRLQSFPTLVAQPQKSREDRQHKDRQDGQ
ncbi:MAG: hypothetical protein ACREPQ_00425 [Rhodanobacter sp.]